MSQLIDEKTPSLLLKWGTVKGWSGFKKGSECFDLLDKYFEDGVSMSCAMDKPDEARKLILCELIDKFDGVIHNDWDGVDMTKEQAKKYIMEFGK